MVHLGRFGPSGSQDRQGACTGATPHDFGPGQDVTGGPSRPGHGGDVATYGPFWDDDAGRASYCSAQSAVVQDGVLLCLPAHSARSLTQMLHRFFAGVAAMAIGSFRLAVGIHYRPGRIWRLCPRRSTAGCPGSFMNVTALGRMRAQNIWSGSAARGQQLGATSFR